MTIQSSALSLKDRRPTKLTGAWSDTNSNAEMNESSFRDSCGADGSKKRRVWVKRNKKISGKETCATACKGTTTEVDVKPTDLLPQCLDQDYICNIWKARGAPWSCHYMNKKEIRPHKKV